MKNSDGELLYFSLPESGRNMAPVHLLGPTCLWRDAPYFFVAHSPRKTRSFGNLNGFRPASVVWQKYPPTQRRGIASNVNVKFGKKTDQKSIRKVSFLS